MAVSTPMRRQYLALKRQHPGTLLLFRLGDFYEAFDDDAKTLAKACDVTLTTRPVGKNQRVPLAGVPHHALDSYLEKLIAQGFKVAIADQMSEPGQGLVAREITQVLTRGTVTAPNLLSPQPNVLASVALDVKAGLAGIAHGELSVGRLAATQLRAATGVELQTQAADELMRLEPSEVLVAQGYAQEAPQLARALARMECVLSEQDPGVRVHRRAAARLQEHFAVAALDGFGLADKPAAVAALGGLLDYVKTYQPGVAAHLTRVRTYAVSDFMALDEFTRLNLELTENLRTRTAEGSLLAVLDRTLTPMGARLLRQWLGQPLLDVAIIEKRLDAVTQLFAEGLALRDLRATLRAIGDLDRWVQRVVYGQALPRDLAGIRQTLARMPELAALADAMEDGPVAERLRALPPTADLLHLLQAALAEQPPATAGRVGLIRTGYNAALDDLVRRARDAKDAVARLQDAERARLDIPSVKVGFNKVFGYYIEVPRAQTGKVPPEYIRKQTLVNAERYVTEELKEYETLILNADEQQLAMEQELFQELCAQVRARQSALRALAGLLARLDVYAALADGALARNYVRPRLDDDFRLAIEGGRHPVVEETLEGATFVPNDAQLEAADALQILTGPNMAGKSTYLRQVALIVLMAQIGSYVPARSARIGIVDRIFTRIGASDAIQRGLSTFMVEMMETAHILNHATRRSLLVLDEIGRGTSTYDGLAIAWAILEYVHNAPHLGAKTLFATHFHELTDLAERLPRVKNYHVAVDDTGDAIAFLHAIREGRAERSFGVHVGRMAGLPPPVVDRADQILGQLEASGAAVPASLDTVWEQLEPGQSVQPALYLDEHPAVTALKELNVDGITPLDAMNKLYELARLAQDSDRTVAR